MATTDQRLAIRQLRIESFQRAYGTVLAAFPDGVVLMLADGYTVERRNIGRIVYEVKQGTGFVGQFATVGEAANAVWELSPLALPSFATKVLGWDIPPVRGGESPADAAQGTV